MKLQDKDVTLFGKRDIEQCRHPIRDDLLYHRIWEQLARCISPDVWGTVQMSIIVRRYYNWRVLVTDQITSDI